MTKKPEPSANKNKAHDWRHCPIGSHYVREHSMRIPPSKKHPKGLVVIRHAHCRTNMHKTKDLLSFDEIKYISERYIKDLNGSLTMKSIKEFGKLGDEYDTLIIGWVRYWNDVLKYKEPLDPKLVKALMGSESSFKANTKPPNGAYGLMQLLPETFAYLRDGAKTDLKNHFVDIDKAHYLDPSANICAGVRWLFRKKSIASSILGRDATWIEAVADYKSYLKNMLNGKNPNPDGMKRFNQLYAEINDKKS
jgi:hypothetical protein